MPYEELVGYVSVDSGTMYVGDPCYLDGDKRFHSKEGWDKFCEDLSNSDYYEKNHLQMKLGVVTGTGYGDGIYPVYVTKSDGRIASVTVVFINDEEE
jgi:hypothetical protein|tara:strand:- start:1523 stop:1813 length:291 start_codon:yes stop_codon:yes gene_type:complete